SNRVSQGLNIAQRFVNTVYCGWKKTMHIYEKYDAQRLGEYGQGGEYVVQEGFGWTNVAMSDGGFLVMGADAISYLTNVLEKKEKTDGETALESTNHIIKDEATFRKR
ncbi:putative trehalase, partial [Brachionus plicatilis]